MFKLQTMFIFAITACLLVALFAQDSQAQDIPELAEHQKSVALFDFRVNKLIEQSKEYGGAEAIANIPMEGPFKDIKPTDIKRLFGLCLGLIGVLLIVGPEASLPERAAIIFVPVALIASLFYAMEGNIVARWGTRGLSPIEVLCGGSLVGALISLPFAVASGQFIDPLPPWGWPDIALVLASLIHVTVYTLYVWMVGRAGPVFAVQVSYLVTGFGVLWAILILGESYSGWVWTAMGVMMIGMFLVQPRLTLEASPETGDISGNGRSV